MEPGEWTLTIKGEELGRVWFKFESVTNTQTDETQAPSEDTNEGSMDAPEDQTLPQENTDEVQTGE